MIAAGTWQLRESERIVKGNEALLGKKHLLVGLTRMRNETLLLPDTLDYLAGQVDAIVAYDDASTDETVGFGRRHCAKTTAQHRYLLLSVRSVGCTGSGGRCASKPARRWFANRKIRLSDISVFLTHPTVSTTSSIERVGSRWLWKPCFGG